MKPLPKARPVPARAGWEALVGWGGPLTGGFEKEGRLSPPQHQSSRGCRARLLLAASAWKTVRVTCRCLRAPVCGLRRALADTGLKGLHVALCPRPTMVCVCLCVAGAPLPLFCGALRLHIWEASFRDLHLKPPPHQVWSHLPSSPVLGFSPPSPFPLPISLLCAHRWL